MDSRENLVIFKRSTSKISLFIASTDVFRDDGEQPRDPSGVVGEAGADALYLQYPYDAGHEANRQRMQRWPDHCMGRRCTCTGNSYSQSSPSDHLCSETTLADPPKVHFSLLFTCGKRQPDLRDHQSL